MAKTVTTKLFLKLTISTQSGWEVCFIYVHRSGMLFVLTAISFFV